MAVSPRESKRVSINVQGYLFDEPGNVAPNALDLLIFHLRKHFYNPGYFLYLKGLNSSDPYDLIPLIQQRSSQNAHDPNAEKYALVAGQRGEISKAILMQLGEFYTLSRNGLTRYAGAYECEHIPMDEWLRQRSIFREVKEKKFFKHFPLYGKFVCWRKAILKKNREKVRMLLEQNLFICNDSFRVTLLGHRKRC